MISGLLASEISAVLKEFIVTGYETEIGPFKGELRSLVEDQQGGDAFIKRLFLVMRQYQAETFYDQNGRIVFTPSKGLTGVGLLRKASKKELNESTRYSLNTPDKTTQNVALGWEDIQHLQKGTVTKTFMDDTLPPTEGSPDGPVERTVEYKAPFFRPDREEDYRVAWELFTS